MKNPWVASLLSVLLPGLGQLYLNEKPKGISILCITLGAPVSMALMTLLTDHSLAKFFSGGTLLFLGLIYLFLMIPSATEAFQSASGKARTFKGDSVPYILVMLFIFAGPFAIPLLWQSGKFPKGIKIGLTILVILIALIAILFLFIFAPFINQFLKQNLSYL